MELNKAAAEPYNFPAIMNRIQQLAHPENNAPIDSDMLEILGQAPLDVQGLMPWSSNYTFLVIVGQAEDGRQRLAIYKPCAGERPLWDFPDGNLCRREFASYLISQILGWPKIPPTVLRNGPHGEGSVQLFVEAEYEIHYFNIRDIPAFKPQLQEMALFDYIVNNADRKGGHCLKDFRGQLWAIDHGLTFHTAYKLRTVIWDFCNQPIPDRLLKDLNHLHKLLTQSPEFCEILGKFINRSELHAFQKRVKTLLASGLFPDMSPGRNVPFPPV
jgi:uncharacterized repeat protein (TIGR03843 family)